jgi:hypothetical protein
VTAPPEPPEDERADTPSGQLGTARARPHLGSGRVLGVAVLVVGLAFSVAFAIGRAARPSSTTASSAAPPSTRPGPVDPQGGALTKLVLQPTDAPALRVELQPGGNLVEGQPTLDVCNASYPSESLRTSRLQDIGFDANGNAALSTEAVLYRDANATTQAFDELQHARAACPDSPVASRTGGDTLTTRFDTAPDTTWPSTPGVTRIAYSLRTTDTNGRTRHTIAVYLRHGRALLGVYFIQPDGAQASIGGSTSIESIVSVFERRIAAFTSTAIHT